jgi:glutathione S-transferase
VREPLTQVTRWQFGDKPRTAEIDEALARLVPELQRLDARLARGPWLAGDGPTAADIAWFPPMRLVVRAERTYPPHWRQ